MKYRKTRTMLNMGLLLLAFNLGTANSQTVENKQRVGDSSILIDLGVLENFSSQSTNHNRLSIQKGFPLPLPTRGENGQLLAPPKQAPQSRLFINSGAIIKTPIIPPPKPDLSVVTKVVPPKTALRPNTTTVVKIPQNSLPSVAPKALVKPVPKTLLTPPKSVITRSKNLLTRAIPKPPKLDTNSPATSPKKSVKGTLSKVGGKASTTSGLLKPLKTTGDNRKLSVTTEPISVTGLNKRVSILFETDSSQLSESVIPALEKIANEMVDNPSLRLLLYGFASGTPDTPSKARRLSLFRALSVRTQIISYGVRSTRMQLRALGNKYEDGSPDRVDIVIAN